jgi:hypothetical protein
VTSRSGLCPLIRKCECELVGTLTIVRAKHPAFTDAHGARRANPVRRDQLLVPLAVAKGETVCYLEMPMHQLPAGERSPDRP